MNPICLWCGWAFKAHLHQTRINSFMNWANNLVWIRPQKPFFWSWTNWGQIAIHGQIQCEQPHMEQCNGSIHGPIRPVNSSVNSSPVWMGHYQYFWTLWALSIRLLPSEQGTDPVLLSVVNFYDATQWAFTIKNLAIYHCFFPAEKNAFLKIESHSGRLEAGWQQRHRNWKAIQAVSTQDNKQYDQLKQLFSFHTLWVSRGTKWQQKFSWQHRLVWCWFVLFTVFTRIFISVLVQIFD